MNMIFRLAPRVLCIRAVIETQAFLLISCSELHCDQQVDRHTCNLLSMIIRCVQRMKQAHVHVLIFTELSLYVKCSPGAALHLLNIREELFFFCFFLERENLLCHTEDSGVCE